MHPDPDAATLYLCQLEWRGLARTTIQARAAARRGLYAGLRGCRAVTADPFAQCRVSHDSTPAWDKRLPYSDDEVAALLQAARDPHDAVLVLLGAHTGLRAQECMDLCWADTHLARRDLVVRCDKGASVIGPRQTLLVAVLDGLLAGGWLVFSPLRDLPDRL